LRLAGGLDWDADRQGTWVDLGVEDGGLTDDVAVELPACSSRRGSSVMAAAQ
jgi:hypothetical protein